MGPAGAAVAGTTAACGAGAARWSAMRSSAQRQVARRTCDHQGEGSGARLLASPVAACRHSSSLPLVLDAIWALVEFTLRAVRECAGETPPHLATAQRPSNTGAVCSMFREGRTNAEFLCFRSVGLASAFLEFPAIHLPLSLPCASQLQVSTSAYPATPRLAGGASRTLLGGDRGSLREPLIRSAASASHQMPRVSAEQPLREGVRRSQAGAPTPQRCRSTSGRRSGLVAPAQSDDKAHDSGRPQCRIPTSRQSILRD
jgi:hypothetical protein